MKTIFLLRHAKSAWDDAGTADFDRPLAPRGKRACAAVRAALRHLEAAPALILCSSAQRTRETLKRIAPALAGDPEVVLERRLYLASAKKLRERLAALDDGPDSVLLIGHNPGLQQLALELAGRGEPAALRQLAAKFPTAGLAMLRFPGKRWGQLAPGKAELVSLWSPKDAED
ncbi:MAG: SixA phosphatase family protein [Alphaproteobacteria bacterium]